MPRFDDDSYFTGGVAPDRLAAPERANPEERFARRQQAEAEEPEDDGWFLDTLAAPIRGIAGAVEGILEVPRIFGADYDIPDNFGLGHSTSVPGSLLEGTTQFLAGFLPGSFGLAHLGKAGKAGKIAGRLTKGKRAAAAAKVAAGDKSAAAVGRIKARYIMARAARMTGKTGQFSRRSYGRNIAAGSMADFMVFTHDEERLSNLLQHWGADNDVINFLAANPDDEAALGRFKNLLEGGGIGFGIDATARIIRNIFRRQKILKDPNLTDKQKEDAIAADEAENATASEQATDEFADTRPDPRPTPEDAPGAAERTADEAVDPEDVDIPAAAGPDDDLAQMGWSELREEAKKHPQVKRGGKGVNAESLRKALSEARKADEEQLARSRAFDEQQAPERAAGETAEEAAERQRRGEPAEHRGQHQPTSGSPLHDLLQDDAVPKDIYDRPGDYGDMSDPATRESFAAIQAARAAPAKTVTIYRSVPEGVTEINSGDWVSLSAEYAKKHGMDAEDAAKDWPVISKEVPAADVKWDGNDFNEFGYFPEEAPRAPGAPGAPEAHRAGELLLDSDKLEMQRRSLEDDLTKDYGAGWQEKYQDPDTGRATKDTPKNIKNKITQRNRVLRKELRMRAAEIIIGLRPRSAVEKLLGVPKSLRRYLDDAAQPHHEDLGAFGRSLIDGQEVSADRAKELVMWLDDAITSGEPPKKIKGVMNTALLGSDTSAHLMDVMTKHGMLTPAHYVDEVGNPLKLHKEKRSKTRTREDGTTYKDTEEVWVNERNKSVTEEELRELSYRAFAKKFGMTAGEAERVISRAAKTVHDQSMNAQSMLHFITMQLRDADELYYATREGTAGQEVREKLGLENAGQARLALERWKIDNAGMLNAWGRYRRGIGRAFYRLRFGAARILNDEVIENITRELGGGEAMDKINAGLFGKGGALEVGGEGAVLGALRTMDKKRRIWFMINEYFVNFILSGVRTFSTNTIGNTATAIYGPLETMVAARIKSGFLTLTGQNSDEMQAEVLRATAEFMGLWSHVADSAAMATKTWKDGKYRLDPGKGTLDIPSHQQEAWSGENWALLRDQKWEPENHVGQRMAERFGKVLRLPSRALMSTDEFFKQLNYRTTVKADLVVEAAALKRSGEIGGEGQKSIDDWIEEEMTALTARGQALIKDNLTTEAERLFDPRDKRYDHARGFEVRELDKKTWIEKQLKGGLVDRGAIADRAVNISRERTFTKDLDPENGVLNDLGITVTKFSNRNPFFRLFVPFIRTPLNIFVYAARRTTIPLLNRDLHQAADYLYQVKFKGRKLESMKTQVAKELSSSDPRVVLDAHGRMMTAVGFTTGAIAAAANGVITGAGPNDKELRRVLTNSGWMPYSIKVGDTYISYQKLDPIATILGLYADTYDVMKWAGTDEDQGIADLGMALSTSVMHNLKSKSYLQGMINVAGVINDPDMSIPAQAGRMLGAFTVPSFLAGAREMSDDSFVEMRGILDGIRSRVPGWGAATMDPMRNAIGEKVNRRNFEGAWEVVNDVNAFFNPLVTNRTTSDIITKEMAILEYPFSTPSRYKYGTDLTEHKNERGQTAYDRWLEASSQTKMGGRTLRQQLERLIKSRRYKSLPEQSLDRLDLESPKIGEIMRIIRRFRAKALRETLREFPELSAMARKQIIARSAMRRGVPTELIRAQLFPME